MTATIPHSLGDLALAYCFRCLILEPENTHNRCPKIEDPTFLACMKAIGMASYSQAFRSAGTIEAAQRFYVDAIRKTNALLASPDCVKDYAILSVMALASFESVVGREPDSLEAWKRHVQGMAALLTIRGSAQLQTSDGRHVFLTAASALGAKCLMLGLHLPYNIHQLFIEASEICINIEDPLWRICSSMVQLVNLYGDVHNGACIDPDRGLRRSIELDEELAAGFDHTPSIWQPTVHSSTSLENSQLTALIPEYHHIYPSIIAAQQWNVMRIGRIMCNTLIRHIALLTRENHQVVVDDFQIEKSSFIIEQMQIDILASVPQYLGATSGLSIDNGVQVPMATVSPQIPEPPAVIWRTAGIEMLFLPSLRVGQGQQLLWSVGLVARSVEAHHPMRRRACKILRLLGEAFGLSQAFSFADVLESDRMANGKSCTLLS